MSNYATYNNVMNSSMYGTLLDLVNSGHHMVIAGHKYGLTRETGRFVKVDRYFDTGQLQCVIGFVDNRFKIYDNNSLTGTKLDGKKLSPYTITVLNDSAFITYENETRIKFFFKFNLHFYKNREVYTENECRVEEMFESSKKLVSGALKMQSLIKNNNQVVRVTVNSYEVDEICLKKLGTKLEKQRNYTEKMTTDLEKYLSENYVQTAVAPSLKTALFNVITKYFLCLICDEIAVQISLTVCGHVFCKECISKWLSKNHWCPVCRVIVRKYIQCYPIGEFIKDMFNLFGGTIKQHRDTMLQQRKIASKKDNDDASVKEPEVDQQNLKSFITYIGLTVDLTNA